MTLEMSEEECQILNALADGHPATKISPYLDFGHTQWSLRRAIEIMRGKLGATTNAQAVAIALREGIIE